MSLSQETTVFGDAGGVSDCALSAGAANRGVCRTEDTAGRVDPGEPADVRHWQSGHPGPDSETATPNAVQAWLVISTGIAVKRKGRSA